MILTQAETTSGKGYWTHLPRLIFHMVFFTFLQRKIKNRTSQYKLLKIHSRVFQKQVYFSLCFTYFISNRNRIIKTPLCQNHGRGSTPIHREAVALSLCMDLKDDLILYCHWWTGGSIRLCRLFTSSLYPAVGQRKNITQHFLFLTKNNF